MVQEIRDLFEGSIWVDVTTLGSRYEVQLNQRNGQWRHRTHGTEEEWRMGPPPGATE